jgi:anti-sigma factor RsiW
MDHLSDSQLLNQLPGTAAVRTAQAENEHLQTCAACRERLTTLQALWNHLGEWTPPQAAKDLGQRILEALPDQPQRQTTTGNWRRTFKVAAALLVAVGLGHMAGRFAWKPATQPPPDETAAAKALYLDDANTAEVLLAAINSPEGDQP